MTTLISRLWSESCRTPVSLVWRNHRQEASNRKDMIAGEYNRKKCEFELMTTALHIVALLKSHIYGDDSRFLSVDTACCS